jgi:hypothetical protein
MAGVKRRVLCTELFKKLNTLPLMSKSVLSLVFRCINTRHKHDLHQQSANLTSYMKAAYYVVIILFSILPD